MKKKLIALVLLSLCWTSLDMLYAEKPKVDLKKFLKDFDEMAVKAMNDEKVPGMAIGIVQGDEVIYLKGFGVKKEGEAGKVDENTVFQLASCSKPVTGTVVAAAVTHGFLKFDDKLVSYVPNFKMKDDWVTREFMVKDALAHRSGLRPYSGDSLESMGYNLNDIIERFQYVEPVSSFRSEYAYQNLVITIGALAAAKAANKDFGVLAKELLFDPLDMKDSGYYFEFYDKVKNKAYAHVKDEAGNWVARYVRHPDVQFGGGGVSSSAHDMSNWLIMYLNNGRYKDKQVIAEKDIKELTIPQIFSGTVVEDLGFRGRRIHIALDDAEVRSFQLHVEAPDLIKKAGDLMNFYGMGIGVAFDTPGGYRYFEHHGAFAVGIRSMLYMLPDDKFGIVVLTGVFPSGLPEGLCYGASALYRTGNKTEAMAVYEKSSKNVMKRFEGLLEGPVKRDLAKPVEAPLPLDKYAGTYKSNYYDLLEIKKNGDSLEGTIGKLQVKLELKHYDGNVFSFKYKGIDGEEVSGLLTFELRNDGNVTGAKLTGFENGEFKKST